MHIRALDLDNPAEIHTFYNLFRDAELAENPDRPLWPEALMTSHFVSPTGDEDAHPFAAFSDSHTGDSEGRDGRMVGIAFTFFPLLDNTEKAYAGVFVAPADRGRGIGSALAGHAVDFTAAAGRSVMLSECSYAFERRADHPYRRFAERHGFALASTEVRRTLDLPVPDDVIQSWIDESAEHHRDYRIETFVNDIPDDLLPSVCHVVNQLALDAPTGDIDMEAEQITPAIRRKHDERAAKAGLTRYETVAVDFTGAAVAVSTMGIQIDEHTKVMQWATIVQREHRGHRLGLATKAHNLRAVQREQPQARSISTCNEEHNGPMVDINERLGFKPVELLVEFQRKLTD